ncbi:hypothetical protein ACVXZ4_05880 [Lacisediminihabitans sp. FW035]
MIAITLMIRPLDSSLWLEFVRHRFRRFESVSLDDDQQLVWIPSVGSLLLTDSCDSLEIQVVVRSGTAASMLRARITAEVSAAVPESVCGDRLVLEWSACRVDPLSAHEQLAALGPATAGGSDAGD